MIMILYSLNKDVAMAFVIYVFSLFFFQTELRKHFTDILQEKLYALRKEAEELHKVRKAEEPHKADR